MAAIIPSSHRPWYALCGNFKNCVPWTDYATNHRFVWPNRRLFVKIEPIPNSLVFTFRLAWITICHVTYSMVRIMVIKSQPIHDDTHLTCRHPGAPPAWWAEGFVAVRVQSAPLSCAATLVDRSSRVHGCLRSNGVTVHASRIMINGWQLITLVLYSH